MLPGRLPGRRRRPPRHRHRGEPCCLVGLAGLVRCGSVWACRGCAQRIAAKRAAKLGELFEAVRNAGGGLTFITLTARHRQPLALLWDGVQGGYDFLLRSRAWSGDKVTFGVQGQVRAVEITYGDAGWHPHLHLCVVTDVPLSQEMAEEMGGRMFDETWRAIRDNVEELLIAARRDGLAGGLAWLAARRLKWVWAGPDRRRLNGNGEAA